MKGQLKEQSIIGDDVKSLHIWKKSTLSHCTASVAMAKKIEGGSRITRVQCAPDTAGCYFPAPRCLRSACFRKYFDESVFCVRLGKMTCGLGSFADRDSRNNSNVSKMRGKIMMTNALLSFFALLLQIYALLSLGTSESLVRSASWTTGTGVSSQGKLKLDAYLALKSIVFDYTAEVGSIERSGTISYDWKTMNCSDISHVWDVADVCKECSDASMGVWSTVLISVLTAITQLQTDLVRSTRRGDFACQKFMGVFTGMLGFCTTGIAMVSYSNKCRNVLPTNVTILAAGSASVDVAVEWVRGTSFICLAVATVMKPINVFAHLILPVGEHDDEVIDDL